MMTSEDKTKKLDSTSLTEGLVKIHTESTVGIYVPLFVVRGPGTLSCRAGQDDKSRTTSVDVPRSGFDIHSISANIRTANLLDLEKRIHEY